jgi:alkanesulfonate monooxygenase SsuD/methylene tetrahydromethanopterin reductase-like flavin-dependent oxidoreductase (luciferase family)
MILDIFSELQRPLLAQGGDELRIYTDAIEQAKLADRYDFGCWWTVEHHGSPDFSYSSTPEIFLPVLAQHTERIHLGHAGVLIPFEINHPIRVAERAAMLDVLSGGRLELGLARSGGAEWETFGVDPDRTRDMLAEALHMIPRMWTETSFKWESDLLSIPERNIIPKPLQRPHPPLWITAVSPEGYELAGRLGVGVLGMTMLTPFDTMRELFGHYERGFEQCTPSGQRVNHQRAVFTFLHCAESEQAAIDSGAAEAALWFVNQSPRVFRLPRLGWINAIRGEHMTNSAVVATPETAESVDIDDPHPVVRLANRKLRGLPISPEECYEALLPVEAVVIGDVETCKRKLQRFADLGADRVMCLMESGEVSQQGVLGSIRRTGEHLVPAAADMKPRA